MLSLPGEPVRTTGIYEANHAGHRARHQALLFTGEMFPRCRQCREYVVSLFLRETSEQKPEHISADPDFR